MSHRIAVRRTFIAALMLLLGACVTARTKVDSSWVDPALAAQGFRKVVIITVAGDEFVQQYFQNELAARLRARGVNAVASHAYFDEYSAAARERFRRTVANSDADAVLVLRLTGREEDVANATARAEAERFGQPDAYGFANDGSVQSDYFLSTTVTTRTTLIQKATNKLVWSASTSTTNAQDGDYRTAVSRLVDLLIDSMVKDKVI
jgi:hypothetical protein